MKFVETKYFLSQIQSLKRIYPEIENDYFAFKNNFNHHFAVHLRGCIYKERRVNTSIPIGKRGGFRFIIFVENEVALPILVYSKKELENVTKDEIKEAVKKVFTELS